MINITTKCLSFLVLLVILAFSFPTKSFGVFYFSDDFSRSDLYEKWNYVGQDSLKNKWKIVGNMLENNADSGESSFVIAKIGTTLTNFEINADINAASGIDQQFVGRVSDNRLNYYQIEFRHVDLGYEYPDYNDIRLQRFENGYYSTLANIGPSNVNNVFPLNHGVSHHVRIVFLADIISVYLDGQLVIYNVDPRIKSGDVGLKSWGGNYGHIRNYYDNYYVTSIGETVPAPVVISLPPPAPSTAATKTIIIPGLGASWNTRAMVYNENVGSSGWKMTPFVNNYDGLIGSLKNNGLIDGEDLFVWNYDWRQPVASIETELNNFIDSKVKSDEKVNLIGHSLGGLTARVWYQNHQNDSRINKVISLGGPQMGSVDSYEAWNGATITKNDSTFNMAVNLMLLLQSKMGKTRVEVLRKYAPVVKDLLPTFDFVKKNGLTIGWTGLSSYNNYLLTANGVGNTGDKTFFVGGIGESTREWMYLKNKSIFDNILGVWPDGRPTKYDLGNGDGTVLAKSAKLSDQNYIEINSNHGEIVQKSIPKIMEILGIDDTSTLTEWNDPLKNKLVFMVGSPARLEMQCDDGPKVNSDSDGFLIYDGNNKRTCQLDIIGTESGTYHVAGGKVDSDYFWNYWENETVSGKIDRLVLKAETGEPTTGTGRKYWFELINREVKLLLNENQNNVFLKKAKIAGEKNNINMVLDNIIQYQKRWSSPSTERIVNYSREILKIDFAKTTEKVAILMVKKMEIEKRSAGQMEEILVKRKWQPTESMALNYKKISELIDKSRAELEVKDFSSVMANSWLVDKLFFGGI